MYGVSLFFGWILSKMNKIEKIVFFYKKITLDIYNKNRICYTNSVFFMRRPYKNEKEIFYVNTCTRSDSGINCLR